MSSEKARQNLTYWFAIYVGIFALMLALQGFMVSLARIAAGKQASNDKNQGLVDGNDKVQETVRLRSRAHGNNQVWAPMYCIMLFVLILVGANITLFHVLAWTFLVVRLVLWVLMTIDNRGPLRRIFAGSNYILFLVSSITCIAYGVDRFSDSD